MSAEHMTAGNSEKTKVQKEEVKTGVLLTPNCTSGCVTSYVMSCNIMTAVKLIVWIL